MFLKIQKIKKKVLKIQKIKKIVLKIQEIKKNIFFNSKNLKSILKIQKI